MQIVLTFCARVTGLSRRSGGTSPGIMSAGVAALVKVGLREGEVAAATTAVATATTATATSCCCVVPTAAYTGRGAVEGQALASDHGCGGGRVNVAAAAGRLDPTRRTGRPRSPNSTCVITTTTTTASS